MLDCGLTRHAAEALRAPLNLRVMPLTSPRETETNMLSKSKIVAFVATGKPERAKDFYEQTLGLRLIADDAFAIVFDASGVMLRVQKVQEHTPANHTVLGWEVSDIQAAVKD